MQFAQSLELSKRAAEIGRPSFFNHWWFFDTNCLSELAKMIERGMAAQVRSFVDNKDVILTATVLQELRKAPDVLESLETALATANVYLAPDITRFLYTDIFNFINIDHIQFNSLAVYPLPSGFLKELTGKYKGEFDKVCTVSEQEVAKLYFERVGPDIGADLDERDLCVFIWGKVNNLAREWFNIEIPIADCHSGNFPAFYIFHYAHYFRYVKHPNVRLDLNDFTDVAHCMSAPYCERFYSELAFANILKNYVQGREPPSAYQLIKKMHKKGMVDTATYRGKKQKRSLYDKTFPMLPNTRVHSFSEMTSQIANSSVD